MPLGLGDLAPRESCPQLSPGVPHHLLPGALVLWPCLASLHTWHRCREEERGSGPGAQTLRHLEVRTRQVPLHLRCWVPQPLGGQCSGVSGPAPIQTWGLMYVYVDGTCGWHEGCDPLRIICLLGARERGWLTFPTPSPTLCFHLVWGPANDVASQHTGFETGPRHLYTPEYLKWDDEGH